MWEVDRLRESLERRAWELEERERDFFLFEERRKRELACEEDELTLNRVRFLGEVRMKEEELDLRLAAANERAEWLEMTEAEVREIKRQVSERLQNIEAERERLRLDRESLVEREKTLDARISAAEKKEEEFNLLQEGRMREIKLKEEDLGKKLEIFDEKVRVWEHELLKHRFMARIESAEIKLEGVKVKMDERFEKIESKCLAELESLALRMKEADRESVEKKLEKMEMEFNLMREEQMKDAATAKIFGAPLVIEPDDSADLKFMVKMDGKTLQIFLNDTEKDMESMGDEILKVLHLSSDPAKLVLDAMEGFYPPHLRKEDVDFNVRRTCIALLEQLIKMCPKIKANVRKEAMEVAVSWRSKMGATDQDAGLMEVLGFLFLLSAFDLVSYFDRDEISSLALMLST